MVDQTPPLALLTIVLYSFAVALSGKIYIVFFVLPICLLILYRKQILAISKKLFALNIFIAVIIISLLLAGDTHLALLTFVRSNLIIITTLLLFAKADQFSLLSELNRYHIPAKITAIIFFAAKLIYLIGLELVSFKKTLHIRHFSLRANLQSYTIIANFLGLLIIAAFERAEALQKTMILRGFNGKIYSFDELHTIRAIDYIYLLLATIAFVHIGVII